MPSLLLCRACSSPLGGALSCPCGYVDPATVGSLQRILQRDAERSAVKQALIELLCRPPRARQVIEVSRPHDLVVHFLQPAAPTSWLVVGLLSPDSPDPPLIDIDEDVRELQSREVVAVGLKVVADVASPAVERGAGRLDELRAARVFADLPSHATLIRTVRDACSTAAVPTRAEIEEDLRRIALGDRCRALRPRLIDTVA